MTFVSVAEFGGVALACSGGESGRRCAGEAGEDAGLALDADGLIFGEEELADQGLMELGGSPLGLHDSARVMTWGAEEHVAEFVSDHAAEQDGKVGVDVVAMGACGDALVVNGGVERDGGGTELRALILAGAGDETKAGSLRGPATAAELWSVGSFVRRAGNPFDFGAGSTEDFVGVAFGGV